jgi:hypothetical protein
MSRDPVFELTVLHYFLHHKCNQPFTKVCVSSTVAISDTSKLRKGNTKHSFVQIISNNETGKK